MFELRGRTALVTGASRGIGREVAKVLASRGARVILAARTVGALAEVESEIVAAGGLATTLELDLAATAEVGGRLAEVKDEVDILVNNAGVTRDNLLARMTLDQWEEVLCVNLTGAYAVTREVVRGMIRRRWGRIISVSSVVGLMGNPGQANYAASKAGLFGFTKSLAREIGSRGITANAVAPGYVETSMTAALPEKSRKELLASVPLRRLGQVEDIAAAVLFLASEEAGYITGEVLNVSGGMHM